MYCSSCGIDVSDAFRYCPQCGTSTGKEGFVSSSSQPRRILQRARPEDSKLAGVCAGIARYVGIDVTLVRLVMLVLAVWPPFIGLAVYVVCWFVMPKEPLLLRAPKTEEAAPTSVRA